MGYPACAGIDPRLRATRSNRPRLPRMRGDRPRDGSTCPRISLATPHARGSTPCRLSCAELDPGYPACAGIDLFIGGIQMGLPRLPRMRGDRPAHEGESDRLSQATPHARGSTL